MPDCLAMATTPDPPTEPALRAYLALEAQAAGRELTGPEADTLDALWLALTPQARAFLNARTP